MMVRKEHSSTVNLPVNLERGGNFYLAAILCASLFLVYFVSISVGFVSPDSWNYLRLAESLSSGLGCSVQGEYFAVFPCGYPALISFTSWVTGLEFFYASKLINIFLLLLSGLFIFLGSRSAVLSFLMVVNPITLAIGHYTWSENLFLFSVSLIFYAVTKASNGDRHRAIAVPIMMGLIAGVFSRYFFGPYAFLMFLVVWWVYGTGVARKVFPYFAFAGLLFVSYYAFNKYSTGHGSGMPRIQAPESLLFLIASFSMYSLKQVIVYFVTVFPVVFYFFWFVFYKRKVDFGLSKTLFSRGEETGRPLIVFILFGVVYLALAFLMRALSQYDLYGYRTVGYGFVFIFSGLLAFLFNSYRCSLGRFAWVCFLGTAVASVLLSQRGFYLGWLSDSRGADYEYHYEDAVAQYYSGIDVEGIVIPFSLPGVKWSVASNPDVFYGDSVTVVRPPIATAPYWEKETFEELEKRMMKLGGACYFDFTRVPDVSSLEKGLNSKFPVGLNFDGSIFNVSTVKESRYHPSVIEGIRSRFAPGELVDCGFRQAATTE